MENYKEPSFNTEKLEESSAEVVAAAVAAPAPKIEKKKIAEPVAVDIEAIRDSLPKPAGEAVVGNGVVDTVKVSSIVYKNLYAKKSLSVHHLQRRLNELNYDEAYGDRDGWFGDSTKAALARFQADNRVGADGVPDLKTLRKLFAGDPNVEIAE